MKDFDIDIKGLVDLDVGGFDTTITTIPKHLLPEVEGEKVPLIIQLSSFLSEIADWCAANINEKIHHANFTITSDIEVMKEKGILHDCDECRDGLARAVVYMESHPGEQMAVGQLYWAVPKEEKASV